MYLWLKSTFRPMIHHTTPPLYHSNLKGRSRETPIALKLLPFLTILSYSFHDKQKSTTIHPSHATTHNGPASRWIIPWYHIIEQNNLNENQRLWISSLSRVANSEILLSLSLDDFNKHFFKKKTRMHLFVSFWPTHGTLQNNTWMHQARQHLNTRDDHFYRIHWS